MLQLLGQKSSIFSIVSKVQALVSDHLGNSEKWSQIELVAYEDG